MADDIKEKDLEKVAAENEKLREQIAEQQALAATTVQQQSLSATKELLDNENEKLKRDLERAKAAVKAQVNANTPAEQAEVASAALEVEAPANPQVNKDKG